MTDREKVVRFIRRGRARLEAARLLRAAARGSLLAGAPALALLLAGKLLGASRLTGALPWALLAAGALLGCGLARAAGSVPLAAAALWLDQRLGTKERLATVCTRPDDEFSRHVAREVLASLALPRLPVPREAGWLPAALFLLFGAGLVPAAERASPAPLPGLPATTAGAAVPEPLPDLAPLLARIAEGGAPGPEEARLLERAIEERVARPEDRSAARKALEKARAGDRAAAREVASALAEGAGGRGGFEGEGAGNAAAWEGTAGRRPVLPYPEEQDFLRAYRRALAEGGS
ncbi:MAG: hypothetical protein ACT4PV_12230 [Planctomycetaceae bacterium]